MTGSLHVCGISTMKVNRRDARQNVSCSLDVAYVHISIRFLSNSINRRRLAMETHKDVENMGTRR